MKFSAPDKLGRCSRWGFAIVVKERGSEVAWADALFASERAAKDTASLCRVEACDVRRAKQVVHLEGEVSNPRYKRSILIDPPGACQ